MRLLQLELKRILTSRATTCILALAVVLSLVMAWLPVSYVTLYPSKDSEITGLQAVQEVKKQSAPYSGEVTTKKMQKALAQYQETIKQYGDINSDEFPIDVYYTEIFPESPLVRRLVEVNADKQGLAPEVTQLTKQDAENFYTQCKTHIGDLMNLEQHGHPAAQEKAKQMYSKVPQPFFYYPGYTTDAMEYIGIYLFLLVFLCTLIAAPVFSAEYQTGADDILRCTKHGRKRLAVTKIAAALLIFAVVFAVCMTIFTVLSNSLFGWECRKTSLQIIQSAAVLFSGTVGDAQNAITAMGFVTLLAVSSFTLFVSSASSSNVKSLGISLVFLIVPSLLYMFNGNNLTAWIARILPAGGIGMNNSYTYTIFNFEFLHLGKTISIWPAHVMLVCELAAIPLFLLLTVRCYQKHIAR
ncbi:ABC transporter permease subunit [Butyricicoccus sp.]|uniref:ABC transporter permease subunit n=1 Tax=Butyricicoccus sp. TaxID=2049021 RepID=UPI003D7E3AC3